LKPERWGSPLVQEKCREEKACDKRHPYRIIIIIIIVVVVGLKMFGYKYCVLLGEKIRDSGRNWEMNNHVQCGRPVIAVLSLNSKSLTQLFNRIDMFLREPYQKSLASVNNIIVSLG